VQIFLTLDFRRCGHDAFDIYEQFALLCAQDKVSRVLVKTGAEDADVHYTLHDVVKTAAMILGGPLDLRVAMIEGSPSITRVYRAMQPALRSLGCDMRVFEVESEAACWLCGAEDCASARLVEAAVPA
jgi:hypothetical protein